MQNWPVCYAGPGDNEVRSAVLLRLLVVFVHEQPADDGVSQGGRLSTRLHQHSADDVTTVNAFGDGALQQGLGQAEGANADEKQ